MPLAVEAYTNPLVAPADGVPCTRAYPTYSSPLPAGVNVGYVITVDEVFDNPLPTPSADQTVNPVNSRQANSTVFPTTDPENVTVIVAADVDVTGDPIQISVVIAANVSTNVEPLTQAVTPPPDTDAIVTVLDTFFTPRHNTSPRFVGVNARVVNPADAADASDPATEIGTRVTGNDRTLLLSSSPHSHHANALSIVAYQVI